MPSITGQRDEVPPQIPLRQRVKKFFNDNIFHASTFSKPPLGAAENIVELSFLAAFLTTYAPDGYDSSTKTYNNSQKLDRKSEGTKVISSLMIWLLTFLGIPANIPNPQNFNGRISFIQIIKNYFAWQDGELSGLQRFYQYSLILPLLYGIFRLISTPIIFAVNILKIATEFLPMFLEKLTFLGATKLRHLVLDKTDNVLLKGIVGLGIGVLLTLHFVFKLARLVGRCITSPATSAYAGWLAGKELGGNNVWAARIIGSIFFLMSWALSLTAYLLLPVLGMKILLANAPAVYTAITHAVAWLANNAAVARVAAFFGKIFSPILTPVIQTIGMRVLPAFWVGLLGSFSVFTTVLTSLKITVTRKVSKIIRKPSPVKFERPAVIHTDTVPSMGSKPQSERQPDTKNLAAAIKISMPPPKSPVDVGSPTSTSQSPTGSSSAILEKLTIQGGKFAVTEPPPSNMPSFSKIPTEDGDTDSGVSSFTKNSSVNGTESRKLEKAINKTNSVTALKETPETNMPSELERKSVEISQPPDANQPIPPGEAKPIPIYESPRQS